MDQTDSHKAKDFSACARDAQNLLDAFIDIKVVTPAGKLTPEARALVDSRLATFNGADELDHAIYGVGGISDWKAPFLDETELRSTATRLEALLAGPDGRLFASPHVFGDCARTYVENAQGLLPPMEPNSVVQRPLAAQPGQHYQGAPGIVVPAALKRGPGG
ncbi:MAG: hypothetical protein P4M15_01830 [Alphaproteobacteria bacterium]|nr:hypothetical protein [Alphaproteobacteria bacterium]